MASKISESTTRKKIQHIIRNYNNEDLIVYSGKFKSCDDPLRRMSINGVSIHYIKIMFYAHHVTFVGPGAISARIFYENIREIKVNEKECIYD